MPRKLRIEYPGAMDHVMSRANGTEWKAIRRGWCLGPAEFKAKRLEQLEGKLGPHHSGELKRETAEARAERIIREELKRLKWRKGELLPRPKSDQTVRGTYRLPFGHRPRAPRPSCPRRHLRHRDQYIHHRICGDRQSGQRRRLRGRWRLIFLAVWRSGLHL